MLLGPQRLQLVPSSGSWAAPALLGCLELLRSWKVTLSRDFFKSTSAHMLMEVSREEGTEALSHWLTALLDSPGGSPGHNLCHLAMFCIKITSDTCGCPLDQKAELGWHPVSTSFPQNTDRDSFLSDSLQLMSTGTPSCCTWLGSYRSYLMQLEAQSSLEPK